jgi:hypothetical protein
MDIDDESVTTLEDLRGDLAHRYKRTPSTGSSVDNAIVETDLAVLDRDGYVIWENLLSTEQCRQIREIVRLGSGTPDATLSRAGAPSASTAY